MYHENPDIDMIRYMWRDHKDAGHNPTLITFDKTINAYTFKCTTVLPNEM